MSHLDSLYSQVKQIAAQAGARQSDSTPCLVPPPHMQWFTPEEQAVLQELERKIIPFIPTGPGSTIVELGGPYLSLFAIRLPVDMALERMGILGAVCEALTSHERWILPRWWWLYKDLVIPSSPDMIAHKRRHILRTREELIERCRGIDFDRCPQAFYPFDKIGYRSMKGQLEDSARHIDWDMLEEWYDFAEEHQL